MKKIVNINKYLDKSVSCSLKNLLQPMCIITADYRVIKLERLTSNTCISFKWGYKYQMTFFILSKQSKTKYLNSEIVLFKQ